eukprot:6111734-Pyramimonas_sp.AAC.1
MRKASVFSPSRAVAGCSGCQGAGVVEPLSAARDTVRGVRQETQCEECGRPCARGAARAPPAPPAFATPSPPPS